jgi:hypothetical protein
MSQMVRKQIYIQKSQEERLKKVAETRGVSEAEIIRQALEKELRSMSVYHPAYDQDAWKKVVAFWEELDQRGPVGPHPANWKRDDLYEERMKRYDRDSN